MLLLSACDQATKPTMAREKCCAWAMLSLMMCAVVQVGGVAPSPSPSPSVDCTSVLPNLADCLSFVVAGSTVAKPEGTCCSGLKKVVKEDVACLCEVFKASSTFGVTLNITKALSLPHACGVSTPPISGCHISIAGVAPSSAPSPSVSPGGSIARAPGPSTRAPGPSTGKSSTAAASPAPCLALLVGVAMALYSY